MTNEQPPGIVAAGLKDYSQHPDLSPTDSKAATGATASMVIVTDCTAAWLESSIFVILHLLLIMRMPTTYTIVDGVHPDDVPDHIQAHWYVGRTGLDSNRRLQGACVAHVKKMASNSSRW